MRKTGIFLLKFDIFALIMWLLMLCKYLKISMSELNAAAIKKVNVGKLKAELSKRNLLILGKKDELPLRLLKVIDHSLLNRIQTLLC